ncbi:uncharacterized protein LOC122242633 [Penaeus japonicus]|uniref:uncharacterized protein LOC122242633 n=1 Tax=Penaeus japonicus TaxID=27405 RepID=UPI001C70EE3C|nr:uncharacterized protein LOC122242633 [Penaeus japonicus]
MFYCSLLAPCIRNVAMSRCWSLVATGRISKRPALPRIAWDPLKDSPFSNREIIHYSVAGGRDARGTVALLRRSRHPERNSARNQSRGEDVRVLLGGTGTHRRPPPLPGGVERQRRTRPQPGS